MRDLRLALRLLWKDRGFTTTAAMTLAVCIGTNTALFTVVDHVLLRPLRVPESDRVLLVYNSYPRAGAEHAGATVPDYFDRLHDLTVFDQQAMFNTRNPSLELSGTPERIHTMQVTPSFFRLIRVQPKQGRSFDDEEGEPGKNRAIILSHQLAERLFPRSNAIGRDLRVDGEQYAIVGVMPEDFIFIDPKVQAWIPLAFTVREKNQRYSNNWAYLGRLKRDVSIAQAQAQIDALNAANLKRFPETVQVLTSTGFHSVATRLQDDLVRDVRPTLYLLWGGALFVLLLGCVNVGSLILVRSRLRLKELATRMALGAGRWRVVRQLVSEHVVLTIGSAGAGLAIGFAVLQLIGVANFENLPRSPEIAMDARIAAATLLIALLMGIGLGVMPAISGLPDNLTAMLREEGRGGTTGRGVQWMRRALIIIQVALAFVLLIGAGLLFASFRHVLTIDPGFEPEGVLTASVNLPRVRYPTSQAIRTFTDDALRALRSIAGVVAAGTTTSIPFGDDFSEDVLLPEGYRMNPGESLIAPYTSSVSPGYFETMRVHLQRGRLFDERDSFDSPRVVIVDERLARRFWPGVDPIGRRMYEPTDAKDILAITERTQWFTVIGVVAEVRLRGLVEGVGDTGAYYMPQAQRSDQRADHGLTFAIRTLRAPESIADAVRTQIARIDPELPVFDVQTMVDRADRSLSTRRLPMALAMAFGFLALFLATIGIYGVLAYDVTQRTKEIGIRIALGSSNARVFQLVLYEGLILIGIGFALGGALVIALRRSLGSQLFGVQATDPVVLSIVGILLASVAVAACAIPARRATRIDPIVALAE